MQAPVSEDSIVLDGTGYVGGSGSQGHTRLADTLDVKKNTQSIAARYVRCILCIGCVQYKVCVVCVEYRVYNNFKSPITF